MEILDDQYESNNTSCEESDEMDSSDEQSSSDESSISGKSDKLKRKRVKKGYILW